jgi:glutathione S-transferase
MKLYYASGTCSLSPHIVAEEAGIDLKLEKIDISRSPRLRADGTDYATINPNLYVPALELDDGTVLTEGAAIVQYLADLTPERGLAPRAGTAEHYKLLSWLAFVATELHKAFSPWLFHPHYPKEVQEIARQKIVTRLAHVEQQLADGRQYLLGERFSIADAYMFTIVGWTAFVEIDLKPFPKLGAYMARIAARPAVQRAMRGEGLKVAA